MRTLKKVSTIMFLLAIFYILGILFIPWMAPLKYDNFAWIFFRANTVSDAITICSGLFTPMDNFDITLLGLENADLVLSFIVHRRNIVRICWQNGMSTMSRSHA